MAPEMEVVDARTLGEAWLEVSRRILEAGADAAYDGPATKELALVTVRVLQPDPAGELIASLADPEWLGLVRRDITQPPPAGPPRGGPPPPPRLHRARRRGRARRRTLLRAAAARLRRARSGGLGDRAAARRSRDPVRDDHHLPAAQRHDLYPLRLAARLLACPGRARARRLRAFAGLRQEGVRQPRRARAPAARGRRRHRLAGGYARDPREIGARLRARARDDAAPDGGRAPSHVTRRAAVTQI